jgi:hypothetical protein
MFHAMVNAVIRSIWRSPFADRRFVSAGKGRYRAAEQDLRFILAVIADQQTSEGGSNFQFPRACAAFASERSFQAMLDLALVCSPWDA